MASKYKNHASRHVRHFGETGECEKLGQDSLAEAWKVFHAFLKQRGDRITETRRIVLARALERCDHFQADDLAADLTYGQNRVSRGTVYRTLALLVQAGLVREIRDQDTHVHYEPIFGRPHHEHMICDKCGEFLEFEDPALARHIDQACKKNDFQQRNHRVAIFGICKSCRGKKK